MMNLRTCSCLGVVVCLVLLAAPVFAAITPAGDVYPTVFQPFNPTVEVGDTSDGSLVVDAGSVLSSRGGRLGGHAGATGTVTITDVGSEWIVNNDFFVGMEGNGILVIEAGGKVTSKSFGYLGRVVGSTGSIAVKGDNSQWNNSREIYVGRLGNGILKIQDGGRVNSWGGFVGDSTTSTGTVEITGAGSKWKSSTRIQVGRNSTLTVSDGAELETVMLNASLGDFHGDGTITVTGGGIIDAPLVFDAAHGNLAITPFGSGGTLAFRAVGAVLGVGFKDSGSLMITEGVTISTGDGHVGYGYGSSATATISGDGSHWLIERSCGNCNIGGSLNVGNFGDGSLTIEAGGKVSSAVGTIGRVAGTKGLAMVSGAGSSWSTSEYFYVGNEGSGTLVVEAGGTVSSYRAGLAVWESSTSEATVTGPGSRWESNSLGVGGRGNGTLNITSSGIVKSVGLTIDSDLDNDSFINMATGGMLALAGDADDSLTQFLDLVSGTDAIRYWNASLADWSPLTAAAFGVDYTLEYLTTGDLAGYTLLTVGRVGDFDNDGDVDGRDFLAWQRNPELGSLADWQNAYGDQSPTAEAVSPVPEPSCLALLLGMLLLKSRRGVRN